MTCTTHHAACDCREAAHAKEVSELRAALAELVACKGLRDRISLLCFGGAMATELSIEWLNREPIAWSIARALATKEPQPAAKEGAK